MFSLGNALDLLNIHGLLRTTVRTNRPLSLVVTKRPAHHGRYELFVNFQPDVPWLRRAALRRPHCTTVRYEMREHRYAPGLAARRRRADSCSAPLNSLRQRRVFVAPRRAAPHAGIDCISAIWPISSQITPVQHLRIPPSLIPRSISFILPLPPPSSAPAARTAYTHHRYTHCPGQHPYHRLLGAISATARTPLLRHANAPLLI